MFEKLKKLFQEDLSPASEEDRKILLRNLEDNKKHYQGVLKFIEELENSEFLKTLTNQQAEKLARLTSWYGRNGIDKMYFYKPKEGIK